MSWFSLIWFLRFHEVLEQVRNDVTTTLANKRTVQLRTSEHQCMQKTISIRLLIRGVTAIHYNNLLEFFL